MVAFSDEAIADLRAIREYIAAESPERATEQAIFIIEKCKILDHSPYIGRPVSNGKRELTTARPWVIVYEVLPSGPYILRVWHGSQDRGR